MTDRTLRLTAEEALALYLLADSSADDSLEVFFHANPELVDPGQQALTKLRKLIGARKA